MGKTSSAKAQMKELMEEELDDFFGGDRKRAWDTDEWEEQREMELGDECAWCGDSDETLNLHHTDASHQHSTNWSRVWMQIEDDLFQESDIYDDSLLETTECCPVCKRATFYSRESKSPTYRCNQGRHEFKEPAKKITGQSEDYPVRKAEWVKDNVDAVREEFAERYQDHWDDYFDLSQDSVITICKTCHYNYHQNGLKPCELCDDGYGKWRTDSEVLMELEDRFEDAVRGVYLCWDHFAETKGLEECDCGDGWYNPQYNSECKSCRR